MELNNMACHISLLNEFFSTMRYGWVCMTDSEILCYQDPSVWCHPQVSLAQPRFNSGFTHPLNQEPLCLIILYTLTGQFSPVFYRTFQSRKCDLVADLCPYLVFAHKPAQSRALQGWACPSVQASHVPPRGTPQSAPPGHRDWPSLSAPLTLARGSQAAFPGRGMVSGRFRLPGRGAAPYQPLTTCSVGSGVLRRRMGSRVWTSGFGREGGMVGVTVLFTC